MRFGQFWVELDGLMRVLHGFTVETIGGYHAEAEVGVCDGGLLCEGFVEEVGRPPHC